MNKNNEFLAKWAEMEGANPTDKFPNLSAVIEQSTGQHSVAKTNEAAEQKPSWAEVENQRKIEQYKKLSWDEMDKSGTLEELKTLDFNLFKTKFKERFGKELGSK